MTVYLSQHIQMGFFFLGGGGVPAVHIDDSRQKAMGFSEERGGGWDWVEKSVVKRQRMAAKTCIWRRKRVGRNWGN